MSLLIPLSCQQPVNCRWGPYGPWSECDGCSRTKVLQSAQILVVCRVLVRLKIIHCLELWSKGYPNINRKKSLISNILYGYGDPSFVSRWEVSPHNLLLSSQCSVCSVQCATGTGTLYVSFQNGDVESTRRAS